jgi:hypothetical protein
MHNRLQHVFNAQAGLGGHRDGIGRVQAHCLLDRLLRARDVGGGKIDLVDDRNHFQAAVDGQEGIGQRLRLNALAGVDDQQRALAGGQRTRDLVAEVDVARRIDQVQLVGDAVAGFVHHANGVRFDGDAALPFQIHCVQHLGLHLPCGKGAGHFQQTVGESRLAVVDMGDDGEIS